MDKVAFDTLKEKLVQLPHYHCQIHWSFSNCTFMKGRRLDWVTNPDSGKHPQTHYLSLKKVESHNKGMAIMLLCSCSYLWHLTGSWIHFGTAYYSIGTTPAPNSVEQKGGYWLMAGCTGKYQAIMLTTQILPCRPPQLWIQPLCSQTQREI